MLKLGFAFVQANLHQKEIMDGLMLKLGFTFVQPNLHQGVNIGFHIRSTQST